jgi:hypothetical protein
MNMYELPAVDMSKIKTIQPRDLRDEAQLSMLLREFSKLKRRNVFIEVGGWKGELSRVMACCFSHVIVIDSWPKDSASVSVRRVFLENIAPYKNVSLLSMDGLAAAALFSGGYADCVYVDDMHDYESMVPRLPAWERVIAPGGVIGGHDYSDKFPGVMQAVNERYGKPDMLLSDSTWMVNR